MLTGEVKNIATQYPATCSTWVEAQSRGAPGNNILSCSLALKLNMLHKCMPQKKHCSCAASSVKYMVYTENCWPSIVTIKVQSHCLRTINLMHRPSTLTSAITLFTKWSRTGKFKSNTSQWMTTSLTFLQSLWWKWSSATSSSYSDCGEQHMIASRSGSPHNFSDCAGQHAIEHMGVRLSGHVLFSCYFYFYAWSIKGKC